MEELIKQLEGKTLTKKDIFDFLTKIQLDKIAPTETLTPDKNATEPTIATVKAENIIVEKPPPRKRGRPRKPVEQLKRYLNEKLPCASCGKVFKRKKYLDLHFSRYPECVKWIHYPNKTENLVLDEGINKIIENVLDKTAYELETLKCLHCNIAFSTTYSLNRHFSTSFPCNQLAFEEFRKAINKI